MLPIVKHIFKMKPNNGQWQPKRLIRRNEHAAAAIKGLALTPTNTEHYDRSDLRIHLTAADSSTDQTHSWSGESRKSQTETLTRRQYLTNREETEDWVDRGRHL
jgi:hypothetical protein